MIFLIFTRIWNCVYKKNDVILAALVNNSLIENKLINLILWNAYYAFLTRK